LPLLKIAAILPTAFAVLVIAVCDPQSLKYRKNCNFRPIALRLGLVGFLNFLISKIA
jgi:hypothetical protein